MNYEIIKTFRNKNSRKMVTFKCEKHGIKTIEFRNFKKTGCHKCNLERIKIEKWIKFKNYVESVSNTKLLSTEYVNNSTEMSFECECGNTFERTLAKFKDRGAHKCRKCSRISMANKQTFSYEYVNNYISENTGCTLLSTEYTGQRQALSLLCECGREFTTNFDTIKNKNKKLCNVCADLTSTGEKMLHICLDKHSVIYEIEYKFKDCINKRELPFDVCVFNLDGSIKALIEYDGEQHHYSIEYFGGEENFKRIQFRDNIKNTYCKKNNIKLIRIPYFEKYNIESILRENDIVSSSGEIPEQS